MIDVEIYDCGNWVIRNIGEELIKENHKNINFYFISELGFGESGYTILSAKEKKILKNGNMIILTEEKDQEGIFLYQAKAKIKSEILKIVGHEVQDSKMEIVAAVSPYNLSGATISNHFLAKELAGEGNKVCMLSFNIDFPYKCIGWNTGNKGLLKALYYYNNQEKFNPGIVSHNDSDLYDYIDMDIKGDEINDLTNDFTNHLMKFLETQFYRYLVLDYGVLYWKLNRVEDYSYFLQFENSGIIREMDKRHLISKGNIGRLEIIELGQLDKIISMKNGQIKFNKDREELAIWKRSLRTKLLKN